MKNQVKIIIWIVAFLLKSNVYSQGQMSNQKHNKMKMNAGIITDKIEESKVFYTELLGFTVTFEN